MTSGGQFLSDQRSRVVKELERYRRQGMAGVLDLLRGVRTEELDQVWPEVSPLIGRLIQEQQDAGQRVTLQYYSGVALSMGLGRVKTALPQAAVERRGLLPSGMPTAKLLTMAPVAFAHRMENGLSSYEAWNHTAAFIINAAAQAAHEESRAVTADVLRKGTPDWETLDAEYERKIREARHRARLADHRRMMRNKSARQKRMMGWGDSNGDPLIQRFSRIPEPGACSFCLMLATAGPVYYEDSFDGPNARFRGNGKARAHNNCRCTMLGEPFPGAYKNVTFGNKEWFNVEWTDRASERTYVLGEILERKNKLVLPPGVSSDMVALVA